jgi:hypothetical protein
MTDQKLLRRDMDDYMARRLQRYPKHASLPDKTNKPKELPQPRRDVFEEEHDPNFFRSLHSKIRSFFRKQ